MERTGLVPVERLEAGARPLDSPLSRLPVERDVAGPEVWQDTEVFGTPPVGTGGDDQAADAALDFLFQFPLEVQGRSLVGLGCQDSRHRAIRAHASDRVSHFAGADLEHIDAFALALEEAKVEDRRRV